MATEPAARAYWRAKIIGRSIISTASHSPYKALDEVLRALRGREFDVHKGPGVKGFISRNNFLTYARRRNVALFVESTVKQTFAISASKAG